MLFNQKSEIWKSSRQLQIEATKETNKLLSEMTQALERFTNRIDKDQQNTIQVTKEQNCILQSSIPTHDDIVNTVEEALKKQKREAEYNTWYNQLTQEVKDDLRWVEEYFKCDKFVAKDFWVQLLTRFQNRARQEQTAPTAPTTQTTQEVNDRN